ncbi:MAG: 1-(5-phosphoribosyl)-5-[(5-phosphoribosylamino)methylideneamino]imidazole-4-carboxamide isomerase [Bacillus thermozeamaize]|uniref:1-(5-phosphoribosyl)-5-[(5-phosphoribosylamino)methylideneamino] imidazole-4-carboxamide isomerase n=1 Tax=Bacillus thermozeamaize TaxID=230954 RepID=A0A1Y3PL72_9BACI|nr:MAG: 1-(5-phosphoribosyl)-5-[(5-phosphoribosylamino)methylideneamino]imidazole-4-carboxamide isomerase [Bacillus thermozeamaize]
MAKFTIYPAIDLRGGQCVRLFQGDYAQETVYGDPVEAALRWQSQGAEWLHVVDLDGAKSGHPVNLDAIEAIVRHVSIPVQVGGGLRKLEHLEMLFERGVRRVILGTAAIENPELVKRALENYGGQRVAIGLDARDGYVATWGWLNKSRVRAEELARQLAANGAETFIFTDISRDGTLSGPNLEAIRSLAQTGAGEVIASGGVSRLEDLSALCQLSPLGVRGVIIGKALYSGAFSLKEAIRAVEDRDLSQDVRN